MKKFFLTLCFFLSITLPLFAGELHTWVDEHGCKHITDTPPPAKAKAVDKMHFTPEDPRVIAAYYEKQRREREISLNAQEQRRRQNEAINEANEARSKARNIEQYKQETQDQARRDQLDAIRSLTNGASLDETNRRILNAVERKVERDINAPQ